jgi:hypothetical protein
VTTYDPGRVHEGTVLLAGYVPGGGLTFFRTDAEALRWLLQPLETGGYAFRPGRRVIRFQVTNLESLSAVLPAAPYLKEAE